MNSKQLEAFEIVKNYGNLFLTGSAGTGKSFTVKSIIDYFKSIDKSYGLTALTGCAAVLINGKTIHSFLGLGISRDLNEIYKRQKSGPKQIRTRNKINMASIFLWFFQASIFLELRVYFLKVNIQFCSTRRGESNAPIFKE